jgi:NAD-dependent deacetylase
MAEATFSPTLLSLMQSGDQVVALTGAGVSAESGLATFRGPDGMWEGRNPMELATPEAFQDDPLTVWRFYAWRRLQAAKASPNPAHKALAAFEKARNRFHLITQNVDGLHEASGSREVLRLHGSLWRLRCTEEGHEFEDLRSDLGQLPPRCECGALLRPAVVWFGEPLPMEILSAAEKAARSAKLVLVAGTSSLVYPAAALPQIAQSAGAYIVEVNPEPTPLTPYANERLAGPAGEILPLLVANAGIPTEVK